MDLRAQALRRQAKAAERYTRLTAQIRLAEARALYARWKEADATAIAAQQEATVREEAVRTTQVAQSAAAVHANAATDALAKARSASQSARDAGNGSTMEIFPGADAPLPAACAVGIGDCLCAAAL